MDRRILGNIGTAIPDGLMIEPSGPQLYCEAATVRTSCDSHPSGCQDRQVRLTEPRLRRFVRTALEASRTERLREKCDQTHHRQN